MMYKSCCLPLIRFNKIFDLYSDAHQQLKLPYEYVITLLSTASNA